MNTILEQLYYEHRQALFTVALSVTGCANLAEDAIHDAFARLCQQGSVEARSMTSYLFRAVRNAATDILRRQQTQQKLATSIFQNESGTTASDEQELQRERLRSALEQLEPGPREIVVLKTYGHLTFEQIGEVLEIPAATAATRYRRAITTLEQLLGNHE